MNYSQLSSTVARVADANVYASGDLLGNSLTAGSVTPFVFTEIVDGPMEVIKLTRVKIKKSGTTVANASFRVHFFTSSVLPSAGDNSAFAVAAGLNAYQGYVDVVVDQAVGDGAFGAGLAGSPLGMNIPMNGGRSLYALVEVRAAYVPGNAEQVTLGIEYSK